MQAELTTSLSERARETSRSLGFDRATVPLLVGFCVLLLIGGMLLWLVNSSQTQSQLVFNAFEVQRSTLRLFRAVQGAESAQRGFLLTGEERYLAPYEAALKVVPPVTKTLVEAAAVDTEKQRDVREMLDLMSRKFAELAQTIDLGRRGQTIEAMALVKSDRGRELMDQIRMLVDRLQNRAVREIDEEYEEGQKLNKLLLYATLGGLAVILALGFFAVRLNRNALQAIEAGRVRVEVQNEALEAAVNERTTELTESNEEIQRFAYIVSHDLRAPLVNVMGFTSEMEQLKDELLANGAKPPDDPERRRVENEFVESIGFIKAAIDKMEGLIAAILRLSREGRRTFRPERIETTSLVEGLANAQRHQIDEAGVSVSVEKGLPVLIADRVALEQIFGNLLDNAVKYLDRGRPGRIDVFGETIGERARISVRDNGRGIAEHDHKRVFELFRRSGEQDRRGDGIGLAHVQTLVRSLGGRITLASELGKGTTFTVILPLAPKAMASPASIA